MSDLPISEDGVYVDIATGAVVTAPPAEGIQLVAPGHEVTLTAQKDIDAYKAAYDAAQSVAVVEVAEEADVDEPEVESVKKKK